MQVTPDYWYIHPEAVLIMKPDEDIPAIQLTFVPPDKYTYKVSHGYRGRISYFISKLEEDLVRYGRTLHVEVPDEIHTS